MNLDNIFFACTHNLYQLSPCHSIWFLHCLDAVTWMDWTFHCITL